MLAHLLHFGDFADRNVVNRFGQVHVGEVVRARHAGVRGSGGSSTDSSPRR
jgi:hypothetical protein